MKDSSQSWYYADSANQPRGPITRQELDALATSGQINSDTFVFQEGTSEWQRYEVLQPSSASLTKKRSAPLLITLAAVAILTAIPLSFLIKGFVIGWTKSQNFRSSENHPELSANPSSLNKRFVMKKTTFYADEATLKELDEAGDRSQSAGDAKLKQLIGEGRIWNVDFNVFVEVLREDASTEAALVKVVNPPGLKPDSFWVRKAELLSTNTLYAKRAARQAFKRSRGDFKAILNGVDEITVRGIPVLNLSDIIYGIYSGKISNREASKYLFQMEAVDAELKSVVGKYLIYEVSIDSDHHYQIAMARDPDWESEQTDVEDAYEQLKESPGGSDDPIRQGLIAVVGEQSFTTDEGFVKVLPVVANINLIP